MSTTTTPPMPPRNNTAPEPQVLPPSESDDFGPIIELGPLEPQTPAQKLQTIADFKPSETLAEQILTDASNPRVPLHLIAEKARTTIEALQAWLAKPEIAERLDNILLSIRQRSKLKLAHELDNITEACATILERFNRAPDRGSTEDRRPDTELRASSIITRNASNALMASRVLLALARYLDGPPRASRPAPTPSNPNRNLNPNRPPSTSPLPPRTSHLQPLRLLPSLASINLHDFREYLTSNHHPPSHAGDEALRIPGWTHPSAPADAATVPPVRRGPPRQPAPTTSIATTSTSAIATHPRPTKPDKSYPSHQSSWSYPPPSNPTPCACGPTNRTTCPSAPTLLTIAGAANPRSRDPTTP